MADVLPRRQSLLMASAQSGKLLHRREAEALPPRAFGEHQIIEVRARFFGAIPQLCQSIKDMGVRYGQVLNLTHHLQRDEESYCLSGQVTSREDRRICRLF